MYFSSQFWKVPAHDWLLWLLWTCGEAAQCARLCSEVKPLNIWSEREENKEGLEFHSPHLGHTRNDLRTFCQALLPRLLASIYGPLEVV